MSYNRQVFIDSLIGKTVEDIEWVEEEKYYLVEFTSGEELCIRLMADEVRNG